MARKTQIRISLRLTKTQAEKLSNLASKTGESSSAIVRNLIDTVDEKSLQFYFDRLQKLHKRSEELKRQNELKNIKNNLPLITELKYFNHLLMGAVNNLNQIAHVLNEKNKFNKEINKSDLDYLKNAIAALNDNILLIRKKVNRLGSN